MSNLKQVTGTGAAVAGPVRLLSVSLSHTAAAGVIVIRDGSGGTDVLTIRCVTDGSGQWRSVDPSGVQIANGVHVQTLTGTASIEYN